MRGRRVFTVAAVTAAVAGSTVGIVLAAGVSLTSAHLGTASLGTPAFMPTALSTTNGGTTAGRVQANDVLTVTYSDQMQASTLCGGMVVSTKKTQGATGTVTVSNNAGSTGNDVLSVTVPASACSGTGIHFGTVDLGSAGYVSGANVVFSSTTVILSQTTTNATITLALGTASGGTTATVAGGLAGVYTPDPALTDLAGNSISANLAQSAATVLF